MSMAASGRKRKEWSGPRAPNRYSGAAVAPRSVCLPHANRCAALLVPERHPSVLVYPYDLATQIARQVGDVFLVRIRRRGRRWCRKPSVLRACFRGGDLSVEPRQPKQQRECTMP